MGKDATLASVEHSHETNEHETFSNQTISMDRFRPRYFKYDKYKNLNSFIEYHQTENHKSIVSLSDVRNGWPYNYHNSFWENYYRNYANETYDFDFSTGWSFPTGPRYKT